jgi:hypothetical protein
VIVTGFHWIADRPQVGSGTYVSNLLNEKQPSEAVLEVLPW